MSYYKNNTLLSTLLEPRGSSPKRADTGILENGIDISNLYYDLNIGGSPPASTGYLVNGNDIANLFAAIGTSVIPIVVSLAPSPANGFCTSFGSCTASVTVLTTASGGTGTYTYSWVRLSGPNMLIGSSVQQSATFSLNRNDEVNISVYACTVASPGSIPVTTNVTVTLESVNLN